MSSNRTEFVFSARDQNVASTANKLRQTASDMGRAMVQEANKQNMSAKDTVKYLEDQVKLLEKKARLEAQVSRSQIDQVYNNKKEANEEYRRDKLSAARDLRGLITSGAPVEEIHKAREKLNSLEEPSDLSEAKKQRTEAVSGLSAQSRERLTEIGLLKELIEAVKRTGRDEVDNEDDNQARDEALLRDRQIIDRGGAEFRDLSNRNREESNNDEGGPGDTNNKKSGINPIQVIEKAASQGDVVGASSSALDILKDNPITSTLVALAGIGMMGLQQRANREISAGSVAALLGKSSTDIVGSNIGATDRNELGAASLLSTREQFVSNDVPTAIRARGNIRNPYEAEAVAIRELALDKGQGLNPGQAASFDKMGRTMDGVSTAVGIYTKMLGATGANVGRGRYADIAQLFGSMMDQQFMRSGTRNPDQTLGTMNMFDQMADSNKRYTDDQYKFQQISSIDQGLTSPGSSEATGIRMAMLRKRFPNATLMELQNEMSKGLGSEGSLEDVLSFTKNTGGDKGTLQQLLSGMFGGSVSSQTIIDMVNGVQSGKLSPSDITKDYGFKNIDVIGEAVRSSSPAASQLEFAKETMTDAMAKVGEGVEELVKLANKILNFIMR